MSKAIRIHAHGGPEVLTYEDADPGQPGSGQILVKHSAIGLNFIDVYYRSGLYPPQGGFPLIPGGEAAGVVFKVGSDVDWLKPGDRVAYAVTTGAYSEQRVIAADRVVKVPDGISDEQAAAMMLKGMTAEYLLRRTFKVKAGDTILFHAAAGGVGLILGQWAKHLGATVIGTASSIDKIELARAHGFDHVINYREQDFVAGVAAITSGKKCDVGRQRHVSSLARLPAAARHVRQLRSIVWADPALQHLVAGAEGLAVRNAADAVRLQCQARRPRGFRRRIVRRGAQRRRQDQDQPALRAQRGRQGAFRSRRAQDHRDNDTYPLSARSFGPPTPRFLRTALYRLSFR